MPPPLEILHVPGENRIVVRWDDGIDSSYSVPYLRAWCPCATCQGHGGSVSRRAVDPEVSATGIFEIGAYAICIRYSDGHDAGILTWEWLFRLRPESPPLGEKHGTFVLGTFRPAAPH